MLGVYGFRFPFLLTICHVLFAFFGLLPVMAYRGATVHIATLRKLGKGLACVAVFMALNIGLNNTSLTLITLSLNQVLRCDSRVGESASVFISDPTFCYFCGEVFAYCLRGVKVGRQTPLIGTGGAGKFFHPCRPLSQLGWMDLWIGEATALLLARSKAGCNVQGVTTSGDGCCGGVCGEKGAFAGGVHCAAAAHLRSGSQLVRGQGHGQQPWPLHLLSGCARLLYLSMVKKGKRRSPALPDQHLSNYSASTW